VEAVLLRELRPPGNLTSGGRPGSKSAIHRVEDRALSDCEAGVCVGSAALRATRRIRTIKVAEGTTLPDM